MADNDNAEVATLGESSFPEILTEMRRMFGTRRMFELVGWCVLAGAGLKETDGPADVRDRLIGMGFSRAAVYRFTADLRELAHSLDVARSNVTPLSMSEVLEEISGADVSLIGDIVVH